MVKQCNDGAIDIDEEKDVNIKDRNLSHQGGQLKGKQVVMMVVMMMLMTTTMMMLMVVVVMLMVVMMMMAVVVVLMLTFSQ